MKSISGTTTLNAAAGDDSAGSDAQPVDPDLRIDCPSPAPPSEAGPVSELAPVHRFASPRLCAARAVTSLQHAASRSVSCGDVKTDPTLTCLVLCRCRRCTSDSEVCVEIELHLTFVSSRRIHRAHVVEFTARNPSMT